jgi:hypothetical protein
MILIVVLLAATCRKRDSSWIGTFLKVGLWTPRRTTHSSNVLNRID